jgi:glycine dehydrogenase subunit 1
MNHRYLPMTEQDQQQMMETIGIQSFEELVADIPESVRFKRELNVSAALSEPELLKYMRQLSGRNADFDRYASFLGAGMYDHHIPVVINHVISRSEFYTAYTPYQPEISQGELQAIFEFQTYICELTGMAVANASMYDGSTAFAEAGAMASAATNRKTLLVSRAVHPEARAILKNTAKGLGLELVEMPFTNDGTTDIEWLQQRLDDSVAAVMIQSPNFFGCIEDTRQIADKAHHAGALLVTGCNPLSLGLLESPGKLGADIVVGDAQPFGIAASLGGPSCGYFATTEKLMRRMPGRIVGQTVDRNGKRGFVLTLQAREQHIRREKATSNICSNQALLALCASVYLSTLGKQGIRDVADLNLQKAHYAARTIVEQNDGKVTLAFSAPFFNEFVVKLPEGVQMATLNRTLLEQEIIGGYDLGRDYPELAGCMLLAVTEQRTRAEIEQFAKTLEVLV